MTKAKAALCVGSLELGIYFSVVNYRDVLLQRNTNFGFYSFIIILIIVLLKWFAFFRDDQWKNYVISFDKWSINKNLKGSWIVFLIVAIIVINFIISCALFSPLRGIST